MSEVKGTTVPQAPKYTKKDFESDQDVRWCPGCGDYAILSAMQKMMPDLGHILRAEYLVDAVGYNRVGGMPLASQDILEAISQLLGSPA